MAAKLSIRARAPPPVVAALLLATSCLVLAASVANASRPLKVPPPPPSSEGDAAGTVVVESPAGYIQTVVIGTAERESAGHRLLNVDMLGGIKDSGPSPGAGH